ncbi:hypothetical protein GALL_378560 [mine drainage metagenome]|uniref:Uncharacterized protein n=1 Tax=mine drainage metagenome TaxID=410659 RepID=A0A1J5Q9R6_9ZZZZ
MRHVEHVTHLSSKSFAGKARSGRIEAHSYRRHGDGNGESSAPLRASRERTRCVQDLRCLCFVLGITEGHGAKPCGMKLAWASSSSSARLVRRIRSNGAEPIVGRKPCLRGTAVFRFCGRVNRARYGAHTLILYPHFRLCAMHSGMNGWCRRRHQGMQSSPLVFGFKVVAVRRRPQPGRQGFPRRENADFDFLSQYGQGVRPRPFDNARG